MSGSEAAPSGGGGEPGERDLNPYGEGSAWATRMARARDLGDQDELRFLWAERDRAEFIEAERRERQQREAALPGVVDYDRETKRLLASDDPDEVDRGKQRRSDRGEFVNQQMALAMTDQVHEVATTEFMDPKAERLGFLPEGNGHPDSDRWVAAIKRTMGEVARSGHDLGRLDELQARLDARVAELHEDPRRLNTTAPGSQAVPGSESPDAQTMDGRIADAEAMAEATGDWSEWSRLQVEASLERARR